MVVTALDLFNSPRQFPTQMIGPVTERESSYLGAFLPSNISHLLIVQLDISNRFSLFVRGGIPVVAEHGGGVLMVFGEKEKHKCMCVNV
jgi:hypothetical protein